MMILLEKFWVSSFQRISDRIKMQKLSLVLTTIVSQKFFIIKTTDLSFLRKPKSNGILLVLAKNPKKIVSYGYSKSCFSVTTGSIFFRSMSQSKSSSLLRLIQLRIFAPDSGYSEYSKCKKYSVIPRLKNETFLLQGSCHLILFRQVYIKSFLFAQQSSFEQESTKLFPLAPS